MLILTFLFDSTVVVSCVKKMAYIHMYTHQTSSVHAACMFPILPYAYMYTPLKIIMEPKHHKIEKENHLPNLHFWGSMLIFQGVYSYNIYIYKYTKERTRMPAKSECFSLQVAHVPLPLDRLKKGGVKMGEFFEMMVYTPEV